MVGHGVCGSAAPTRFARNGKASPGARNLGPRLRCAAIASLFLLFATPVQAHPGSGGGFSGDRLEAESYLTPDASCDPDFDNEHTTPVSGAGNSGGRAVFLPHSGCTLHFGSVSFATARTFTSVRANVGGISTPMTYAVTVRVDGSSVGAATFTQQASAGLQVHAITGATAVQPGLHTVDVTYTVVSGPSFANLFIDYADTSSPTSGLATVKVFDASGSTLLHQHSTSMPGVPYQRFAVAAAGWNDPGSGQGRIAIDDLVVDRVDSSQSSYTFATAPTIFESTTGNTNDALQHDPAGQRLVGVTNSGYGCTANYESIDVSSAGAGATKARFKVSRLTGDVGDGSFWELYVGLVPGDSEPVLGALCTANLPSGAIDNLVGLRISGDGDGVRREMRGWIDASQPSSPFIHALLTTYVVEVTVPPSAPVVPPSTLPLLLGDVVDTGYAGATPAPGCTGRGGNTLGYTTCGPDLDRVLAAGQTGTIAIEMGDYVAFGSFSPPPPLKLGVAAQVTVPGGTQGPVDVARLTLNGDPAGFLSVSGGVACLRGNGQPACPPADTAWLDSRLVDAGTNLLRIEVLRDQVVATAAAIQLAAPPTFILHGFTPVKDLELDPPPECLPRGQPGFWNRGEDMPQTDSADWRFKSEGGLSAFFQQGLLDRTGQHPWAYTVGTDPATRDPALNPYWTYCGGLNFAEVGKAFRDRMDQLKRDGFNGQAWVIAHSMGGLVVRYYTDYLGGTGVGRLAMMGTPNEGSCLAAGDGGLRLLINSARRGSAVLPVFEGLTGQDADWGLLPSNPWLLSMNGRGLSPKVDYLALSGQHPAMLRLICTAFNGDTQGDLIVPASSSRFDGRMGTGRDFDVRTENCTPHSGGIPMASKEHPYYAEGAQESRGHMLEWLLDPHDPAPYPGRHVELSDCPTLEQQVIDGVVSWGISAVETGKEVASDIGEATVREVQRVFETYRRCCIILPPILLSSASLEAQTMEARSTEAQPLAAQAEGEPSAPAPPSAERAVTLSGADAQVLLVTPIGETHLTLGLVDPEGTSIGPEDAVAGIERSSGTGPGGEWVLWNLTGPAPGPWTVRVVGSEEGPEISFFELQVREAGAGRLEASFDALAYSPGDEGRLQATLELPAGGLVAQVSATVEGPGGNTTLELEETGPGAFEAGVLFATPGAYSVVVLAQGQDGDGSPFERRASLDVRVLHSIDWAVSQLELSATRAWRGDTVEASVRACSVGPERAEGPVDLVLSQGGRAAAAVEVELAEGEACADVLLPFTAFPGTGGVSVRALSALPEASEANNQVEAALEVLDLPSSVARLSGVAGAAGWFRSAVTVSIGPYDGSAPLPTTYSLDGGAATSYAGPFAVAGDGVHAVAYRATDPASGEVEALKSTPVRIDTVAPETAAVPAGDLGPGGWYRSEVALLLAGSDATSGVALSRHRIDGGPWLEGSEAVVAGDGTHLVEYASVDVAGNEEAPKALTVRIDTVAPDVELTDPAPNSHYKDDRRKNGNPQDTKVEGGKTLRATAGDSLTAIHRVEFLVDGEVVATDSEAPYEAFWSNPSSSHERRTIAARAVDLAGNVSEDGLEVKTKP